MRVTATFLGSQVSLGFEPGQSYLLQVTETGTYLQADNLVAPFQRVPYSSWATFLDNWGFVTKLPG